MRNCFAVTTAALALTAAMACSSKPAANASTPASSQPAADATPPPAAQAHAQQDGNAFTGSIAETMNSGGYTYARLKSGGRDDVWIAAPQFDAKMGETVSVSLDMPMQDFQSKTLNRTFPLLYFVQEVARNGQPLSGSSGSADPASMMKSHGGDTAAGRAAEPVGKIDPPAGGMSIADVFAKKASLSGKPVTVRGKVVKFNGGILDRNWLHIQDGSGSADAHNNDLTVTTNDEVKVGDVVTVSGVLGTGKDFGAGYAYDAIVEKATVKAE